MRRVIVTNNVSLDGVMQAPARPDEDTRGGFDLGGWALPYNDEIKAHVLGQAMAGDGDLLLGRRTYLDFAAVWPQRTGNPFTEVLNHATKYVASTTLETPLPWENSILLTGEAGTSVAELKSRPGRDLVILGSGDLTRSLARHGLIDRYVLLVHPLLLGRGQRLFVAEGMSVSLTLVDQVATANGVTIATYDHV